MLCQVHPSFVSLPQCGLAGVQVINECFSEFNSFSVPLAWKCNNLNIPLSPHHVCIVQFRKTSAAAKLAIQVAHKHDQPV